MSLLQRYSIPLAACRSMANTAFPPARAVEPAQDEALAAAPTHDRSYLMPPGAVESALKGVKATGDLEHKGSADPHPDIRRERGDLSPIGASQPRTDFGGFQQRPSSIAGSGRRGR